MRQWRGIRGLSIPNRKPVPEVRLNVQPGPGRRFSLTTISSATSMNSTAWTRDARDARKAPDQDCLGRAIRPSKPKWTLLPRQKFALKTELDERQHQRCRSSHPDGCGAASAAGTASVVDDQRDSVGRRSNGGSPDSDRIRALRIGAVFLFEFAIADRAKHSLKRCLDFRDRPNQD